MFTCFQDALDETGGEEETEEESDDSKYYDDDAEMATDSNWVLSVFPGSLYHHVPIDYSITQQYAMLWKLEILDALAYLYINPKYKDGRMRVCGRYFPR